MNLNKFKKKLRGDGQDEAKSRNEDSSFYLKTSNSRPQTLDPKSTSQIIEIQPSTSSSSYMKTLKAKVRNLTSACAAAEQKRGAPKNLQNIKN